MYMLYNRWVNESHELNKSLETSKHIQEIKGILGVNAGAVTDRILDAIIKATLGGNKAQAEKLLQSKLSIDEKSTDEKSKLPKNIADQIISTIEEYMDEKGIAKKEPIPQTQVQNATLIIENPVDNKLTQEEKPKKKKQKKHDMKNVSMRLADEKDEDIIPDTSTTPDNIEEDNAVADEPAIEETIVTKEEGIPDPEIPPVIEEVTDQELLERFDKMVEELEQKEKALDKNLNDLEKIESMRDLAEEYDIQLSYIEPIYSKKEIVDQKREREEKKLAYEEREKVIKEIGEMLKGGIDKVVIHGNNREKGDDVSVEPKFGRSLDLDTQGALYFLNLAKEIKYKKNSRTELSKKGEKTKNKQSETVLYIDTSGERLSFKKGRNGKEIFIDHHQESFSKYDTSATELMYEVLEKNKMIEKEPWMRDVADFVTDVDNLSYVKDEGFNEKSLEHKWPKSLFGIYKDIPFEKIATWIKEGRDPYKPDFTEDELNGTFTRIKWKEEEGKQIAIKQEISLRDIIKEKEEEIGADISNAKFAVELMKKRGIKLESKEVGKIIYNKRDRQKEIGELDKKRNKVNRIDNGFLVAKALGYDTYATYYEEYNKFMVNTNTYNLNPIHRNFKKIIPETVLVRGVMLMQPLGLSKRSKMTEEKFLKLLGLK